MHAWQKCFELRDGQPTGRWQWACESRDGTYLFPGVWMSADAIAVPPELRRSANSEMYPSPLVERM